ncbi:MAG: M67 family metallopeptidase [Rhodospirillales bacterium]
MILLPEALRRQLQREAEAAYPEECCGLLVGQRRMDAIVITRAVASNNIAVGRRHDRFEVDPQVRFRLSRELAGTAQAIVGHYHSHPDHPPEPSATDRALAFEPDLVWVIVGVGRGPGAERPRAGPVRGFRIDASGGVAELRIAMGGTPVLE